MYRAFAIMRTNSPEPSRPIMGEITMDVLQTISKVEQQRCALQRAMSIAEFCQRYGIGRTTAYAEIKEKRLRGRKIGKRTIITEDDAEEWLRHLPVMEAPL